MLPLGLCLVMISIYIWIVRHSDLTEKQQRSSKVLFQVFLLVLFLILPMCSSKIFGAFNCDTFKIDSDGSKVTLLERDYSIRCTSYRYKVMTCYAIFMIICYPIGVPCLFAVLLWHDRRELVDPIVVRYISQKNRSRNSTPLHFRASITSTALSVTLDGPRNIYLFLFGKATLGKMGGMGGQEKDADQEEWEELASNHRLSFLLSSYERRVYWYEVLESVRRISLSGMLVVFGPGSNRQLIIGCVVSLIFLRVNSCYAPHVGDEDNLLSEICDWQLFLILFITLLLKVDAVDETSGIILLLVLLFVVFFLSLRLIKEFQIYLRATTQKENQVMTDKSIGASTIELPKRKTTMPSKKGATDLTTASTTNPMLSSGSVVVTSTYEDNGDEDTTHSAGAVRPHEELPGGSCVRAQSALQPASAHDSNQAFCSV